ncbi:MAG: hypothetical protein H5T60_01835 [Anaerolineae bacterium]|nr:hypothetical protein [Anaerolineae bacterium]
MSQARRRQAPAARPTSTEAAPASVPASSPQTSVRAARSEMLKAQIMENLRHEYRYVLADLRRLGIIAAVMFGVLIALAFVFPLLGF